MVLGGTAPALRGGASRAGPAQQFARAVVLCALLCACSPGAFDDLVGSERAAPSDAAVSSGKDGGPRAPGDGGARGPGSDRDGASDASDAAAADAAAGTHADASAAHPGAPDAGGDGGSEADAASGECARAPDPANVRISTRDLGEVPVPPWVSNRGLVASAAVGERMAWVFHVPGDRSMVAWGGRDAPLQQFPQLNEQGPFTPFLPGDAGPNTAAFSPTSIVGVGEDEALVFYSSQALLVPTAVGLARLRRDQLQADALRPLDLFPKPEPVNGEIPWRPLFNLGAVIEETATGPLLYLYACHADQGNPEETAAGVLSVPCRVARVVPADAAHHRAYRHWDGRGWNEDPLQSAVVVRDVIAGVSVSFNRYLGAYLMVHSGRADDVMLRAAPRPEGPWRTLGSFATLPGGGPFGISLGAAEHPALRDACEQLTYVSYVRELGTSDETGQVVSRSETRFVRVRLE